MLDWFYLKEKTSLVLEKNYERSIFLRRQGEIEARGLDGDGYANKFSQGVVSLIGDPEVAAGVDSDGEGLEEFGVGSEASGRGKDLAGRIRGRTGEFGEGGAEDAGDPDAA